MVSFDDASNLMEKAFNEWKRAFLAMQKREEMTEVKETNIIDFESLRIEFLSKKHKFKDCLGKVAIRSFKIF